ncbi:DUF4012 domain-containing protein [Candidatus Gracilibacteria bacterium]|nr:DUF4012 domain-containing protein [Candidatus Gracilibacteria bacterium]
MTATRTLDLARHGEEVSDILSINTSEPIDLREDAKIRINRFHTTETLDLAIPEVVDPTRWEAGLLDMVSRPRTLDIVDPFSIPYGALDVRRDPILSTTTYPDLYARELPLSLVIRRVLHGAQSWYRHHRKQIGRIVVGLLVFSIPVLSYVAYALTHGYQTLQDLAGVRTPETIRTMIRSARGDFERASFLFSPFSWIPIGQIDTVRRSAAGGLTLTRGLDMIAQALPATLSGSTVTRDIVDPLAYRAAARDISPLASLGIENPTDWIVANKAILEQAKTELQSAGEIYGGVIPTGERTIRMQKIGKTLSRLATLLDWSLTNDTQIENMLGHTNPQRYIVFNQNRDEIRANGGFPGSILSFTLYKGNILDYHADDVYYYDWNLYPYKEIPPPGIALLTGSYGLRDVNYYPDFHETLDRANSFIERSGDASVTTAIAIHQGIIEDILDKTGPITLSGVAVSFDSHNFSRLMSTLVENRYAQVDTPKDILFRFGSALLSHIQSKNLSLDILDIMEKNRQDGEILFASRDTEIDTWLAQYQKKLPWQQSSSPNWIYPLWTSVSGNKSDRYIDRTYQATVKKIEGCKYENTITLSTHHTFAKSDTEELRSYFKQFNITDKNEQAKLEFIQGDGKNRAFVRVYVPLGSTLIGAGSDITVTSSEHATVFSTLIETPVGASTSKSWRYTLDIPACESYTGSVEWTRQPGLRSVIVK